MNSRKNILKNTIVLNPTGNFATTLTCVGKRVAVTLFPLCKKMFKNITFSSSRRDVSEEKAEAWSSHEDNSAAIARVHSRDDLQLRIIVDF